MNRLCSQSLITQSVRYGHWFTKLRKVSRRQLKPNIPKYTFDYEHERWHGKPLDTTPTILEESELFRNATDEVKKLYTYDFLPRKEQTDDALQELFQEVGIDAYQPKDQDLASHIVRLTFSIRDMKAMIEKRPRDGQLRAACATYIGRRKGLLHQLRRENLELFERLCSVLNIEYRPFHPFDIKEKAMGIRKLNQRDANYQIRRQKIMEFREKLANEREAFYADKEEIIQQLNEQLKGVNLDIRTLFDQVVSERQHELMRPVHQDDEHWYEQEKELKEMYARLRAEKEERLAKKKRK